MTINLSVSGKMPLTEADLLFPDTAYATTSGKSAETMNAFTDTTLEIHLFWPDPTISPSDLAEITSSVQAGYIREGWTDVTVTSI